MDNRERLIGTVQVEGSVMHTIAVNVVWDADCQHGSGCSSLLAAITHTGKLLRHVVEAGHLEAAAVPQATVAGEVETPNKEDWNGLVSNCLASLEMVDDGAGVGAGGESEVFNLLDGLGNNALTVGCRLLHCSALPCSECPAWAHLSMLGVRDLLFICPILIWASPLLTLSTVCRTF